MQTWPLQRRAPASSFSVGDGRKRVCINKGLVFRPECFGRIPHVDLALKAHAAPQLTANLLALLVLQQAGSKAFEVPLGGSIRGGLWPLDYRPL
jgi:hypothetical protein